MPKSINPMARRKSSSPFSTLQRKKPGARPRSLAAQSLEDTGRKEGMLSRLSKCSKVPFLKTISMISELLAEMNNKLSQAVKLYDHLLTEQLARPRRGYGSAQTHQSAQPIQQPIHSQPPSSTYGGVSGSAVLSQQAYSPHPPISPANQLHYSQVTTGYLPGGPAIVTSQQQAASSMQPLQQYPAPPAVAAAPQQYSMSPPPQATEYGTVTPQSQLTYPISSAPSAAPEQVGYAASPQDTRHSIATPLQPYFPPQSSIPSAATAAPQSVYPQSHAYATTSTTLSTYPSYQSSIENEGKKEAMLISFD